MIAGLHQNDPSQLSALSVKSVSTFNGNNRAFPHANFKVKVFEHLNIALSNQNGRFIP